MRSACTRVRERQIRTGRGGRRASAFWVSWAASRKAEAASSCSWPAVAMLLPYVAVAAFRTCSWARVRLADSMGQAGGRGHVGAGGCRGVECGCGGAAVQHHGKVDGGCVVACGSAQQGCLRPMTAITRNRRAGGRPAQRDTRLCFTLLSSPLASRRRCRLASCALLTPSSSPPGHVCRRTTLPARSPAPLVWPTDVIHHHTPETHRLTAVASCAPLGSRPPIPYPSLQTKECGNMLAVQLAILSRQ